VSKAGFQAQATGGLGGPRVGTVGTIPAQREPDRRNFRFGHRSVDELQPFGPAGNRSRVKGGPLGIGPEARPSPVPGPLDQPGAQRVSLNETCVASDFVFGFKDST